MKDKRLVSSHVPYIALLQILYICQKQVLITLHLEGNQVFPIVQSDLLAMHAKILKQQTIRSLSVFAQSVDYFSHHIVQAVINTKIESRNGCDIFHHCRCSVVLSSFRVIASEDKVILVSFVFRMDLQQRNVFVLAKQ